MTRTFLITVLAVSLLAGCVAKSQVTKREDDAYQYAVSRFETEIADLKARLAVAEAYGIERNEVAQKAHTRLIEYSERLNQFHQLTPNGTLIEGREPVVLINKNVWRCGVCEKWFRWPMDKVSFNCAMTHTNEEDCHHGDPSVIPPQ